MFSSPRTRHAKSLGAEEDVTGIALLLVWAWIFATVQSLAVAKRKLAEHKHIVTGHLGVKTNGAPAPLRVDNTFMSLLFTRALRLKVRRESYGWLGAAAIEVNQVFNYCNQTAWETARRTDRKRKWLSGFDLCGLTAGAAAYFERIGSDTVQRICTEYAQKRAAAKRSKLRWRVSGGPRRSLGWVPFKAESLKRKGRALRFCGKAFRVFAPERLDDVKWGQGCFAQDAVGDWWL